MTKKENKCRQVCVETFTRSAEKEKKNVQEETAVKLVATKGKAK